MYMRLTGTSIDTFKYLEPLYLDYRKIRVQNRQGGKAYNIDCNILAYLQYIVEVANLIVL